MLFRVDSVPYPETWNGDEEIREKETRALEALETLLEVRRSETAGVIVEPLVQGAGGMRMIRPAFLKAVAERVKEAGLLLIFDEVMTGFGRTGGLFATLTANTTPI